MSLQALGSVTGLSFQQIVELIDNRLLIRGTEYADPNGQIGCAIEGVLYVFVPTRLLWICTVADAEQDPGSTSWEQLIFSIQPASEDDVGVVRFCTPSELLEGTANNLAVTPLSMANVFQTKTGHTTDFNNLQNQITTQGTSITTLQGIVNAATSANTASAIVKRDGNKRFKAADPDANDDVGTKGYIDGLIAGLQAQITVNYNDLLAATDGIISAELDLVRRDSNGYFQVKAATNAAHPIRKDTFDSLAGTVTSQGTSITGLLSDMSTAQGDILDNANDISDLTTALSLLLGGEDVHSITLNASGDGTPTSALIALTPETGTSDTCNHLKTDNNIRLLLVYNALPGTNTLTLANGSSGDGYLANNGGGSIVLSSAGQGVIYKLDDSGATHFYKEVVRIGFASLPDFSSSALQPVRVNSAGTNIEAHDQSPSQLTIASGVITPTKPFHTVETQGAAGSDELDTMATTSTHDGGMVTIMAANASHIVVVKDLTGNLKLVNGDFSLDNAKKSITFRRSGSYFIEICRNDGASSPPVESSDKVATVNTTQSFTHGIGAVPSRAWFYFRCTSAENGYSSGDKVFGAMLWSDGTTWGGGHCNADSTTVEVRLPSYQMYMLDASRAWALMDPSKWKLVICAQR